MEGVEPHAEPRPAGERRDAARRDLRDQLDLHPQPGGNPLRHPQPRELRHHARSRASTTGCRTSPSTCGRPATVPASSANGISAKAGARADRLRRMGGGSGTGRLLGPRLHRRPRDAGASPATRPTSSPTSRSTSSSGATTQPFFLMCHHKAPHRNSSRTTSTITSGRTRTCRCPRPSTTTTRAAPLPPRRRRCASAGHELARPGAGAAGGAGDAGRASGWWTTGTSARFPSSQSARRSPSSAPSPAKELHASMTRRPSRSSSTSVISSAICARAVVDDNVGRILDYLDEAGLAENTIVIYTSDQGFFLGEHGWFDKRLMYEESAADAVPHPLSGGDPGRRRVEGHRLQRGLRADLPRLCRRARSRATCRAGAAAGVEGRTPEDWGRSSTTATGCTTTCIHEAWAHYGVRDQRYKLVYWYNDDLGQPGARPNGAPPEWELFDCEKDPSS